MCSLIRLLRSGIIDLIASFFTSLLEIPVQSVVKEYLVTGQFLPSSRLWDNITIRLPQERQTFFRSVNDNDKCVVLYYFCVVLYVGLVLFLIQDKVLLTILFRQQNFLSSETAMKKAIYCIFLISLL